MNLDNFKSFARAHEKKIILNFEVWLYTRVSSRDQELNRSLESQTEAGKRYAQVHNYNVTSTFGETYESASGDFTRKEFMKLIAAVRKARKKPFAILIYTMSRFSRSGGGGISLAHELVDELGVHLIEVATGKNTMTEEGKLEIYRGLIRASQDNIDRLKVTVPGMIKMLEAGHWLGTPPPGYIHFGPRVKDHARFAPTQRIEPGKDFPFVRRGWDMKLKDQSDNIIIYELKRLGYKISPQKLSKIWRNPFYCGVSTNKLLNGRVIKGNWQSMVTEKEFFQVQEILKGNKFGYKNEMSNPHRPLMGFLRCPKCDGKMTGYEVLDIGTHYYKCQKCKDCTINADTTKRSKGKGAHELFIELLKKYELDPLLIAPFKEQIKRTFEKLSGEKNTDLKRLSTELEKLQAELKMLQRRYALEGLDKDLYEEFKKELEDKIQTVNHEVEKSNLKISNIDKCISISIDVAQNLSNYWAFGRLDVKKKLQQLVFPNGLVIDIKNRAYLTKNLNSAFSLTAELPMLSEDWNEKSHEDIPWLSLVVAGDGFEPTTFGL